MYAKHPARAAAVGAALAFVVVGAPVAGAVTYFGDHALPGTTVGGVSVSGMTEDQVRDYFGSYGQGETTLVGPEGQSADVSLADAGISVDVQASTEAVFAPARSVASRISGLFGTREVEPVVRVDEDTLSALLVEKGLLAPNVDVGVSFDADAGAFVSAEPREVLEADPEAISSVAAQVLSEPAASPIVVPLRPAAPVASADEAAAAATRANDILKLPVRATDGGAVIGTASPEQIAAWMCFEPSAEGVELRVDSDQVAQWLRDVSAPNPGDSRKAIQNVDATGAVVASPDAGVGARYALNAPEAAQRVAEQLEQGLPADAALSFGIEDPAVWQIPMAEGDRELPFQPAAGQKWIDMDLTEALMTAYEGTVPVMRVPFVPGTPQTPTVQGTFEIYAKYDNSHLTGLNLDGSTYDYPNVRWFMSFHGAYGIHSAYWRNNFGEAPPEDGSHGCANVSEEVAGLLYEWAPIGTVVISHQ